LQQVPCVSSDEGFCENSHTTTGAKEANPGSRKTHAKLRKNPNPKQITQVKRVSGNLYGSSITTQDFQVDG